MAKKFWKFRNMTGGSAELLLYGDISDTSWWGDEVTPKEFAEDLNGMGAVSEISVRINSGGGDVFAAQAIGNLLEQHPANVTARIDGLCASAATIVACHCNKVIAANDSTYMVHPVKMGLIGYLDAVTMQQYIDALTTIRENIVTLYAKKTRKDKEEVAAWMDATSWWTGPEAKEKGFVDELVDNDEDAVVENRNGVLFVNSVSMNLPFSDAPAELQRKIARQTPPKDAGPKSVQDSMTAPAAAAAKRNGAAADPAGDAGPASSFVNNPPVVKPTGKTNKEETHMEIQTAEDLRREYPALVDQIEQAAARTATESERQRIQDIEEMALPGSEELTAKAKFTEPMDAAAYAKAMVKHAKTQGAAYLEQVEQEAEESGVNEVGNAAAPGNKDTMTATVAQAKADAALFLETKKGRK